MPALCEGSVNTNSLHPFFLKTHYLFILFLAVVGLCCCIWAFPSCGQWLGGNFVVVCGLLLAVASLAVEHML